jgi:hypothetical protein
MNPFKNLFEKLEKIKLKREALETLAYYKQKEEVAICGSHCPNCDILIVHSGNSELIKALVDKGEAVLSNRYLWQQERINKAKAVLEEVK